MNEFQIFKSDSFGAVRTVEVKERSISNPDGSVRVTKTTKVTGKG